jgi:hypothetical protein
VAWIGRQQTRLQVQRQHGPKNHDEGAQLQIHEVSNARILMFTNRQISEIQTKSSELIDGKPKPKPTMIFA